ncbi:unnamed protein product [Oppiella nova]|uniref:Uncharacterized protein n=1 Tax=Oppiella nova TaxID=334625 RepID=A0A7R9MCZ3_9ACAR|nr:unnamed protein product [Oppiella nova]CAG2174913.1 unnamed protein product [Oppiella nova]
MPLSTIASPTRRSPSVTSRTTPYPRVCWPPPLCATFWAQRTCRTYWRTGSPYRIHCSPPSTRPPTRGASKSKGSRSKTSDFPYSCRGLWRLRPRRPGMRGLR